MRVDDSLKFARVSLHNLEIRKSELEKQLNLISEQIVAAKASICNLENNVDKCNKRSVIKIAIISDC